MTRTAGLTSATQRRGIAERIEVLNWRWIARFYVRVALAAAFLSAVGSRFGMYGKNVGWGNFANFTRYTAEVNSFMPAWTIPYIAWIATAAEVFFALALLTGIWPRWVALGTALLLALFGTAMAISFGIRSPLDYSVFSASAAAFLLAVNETPESHPA
ncbi:MAG TPA: MauE/DoxX family redox-associated membrane protein [Terriglobales bacterium]|nr:MauE/DoxX family redox-associated membrane protein [Terriglobales bacterium]